MNDKNLKFVFAAYSMAWLIFIFYAWILSRRQARLRKDLDDLKTRIQGRAPLNP